MNNTTLKIKNQALPYIVLQRTNYFNKYFEFLPYFLKNLMLIIFSREVKSKYSSDMFGEYQSIKEHILGNLNNVLDIGCGLAGIDVFLYKNHGSPSLYLLDKTQMDKSVHYGYEKEGSYYNSLALANELLIANGVPAEKIILKDVKVGKPQFEKETFDLIISLISWGFHYPISTYSNMVYDALNSSGVLILDIRKDTSGKEELSDRFSIEEIKDYGKYIRYVCRKRK